jgi:hypothetical protein
MVRLCSPQAENRKLEYKNLTIRSKRLEQVTILWYFKEIMLDDATLDAQTAAWSQRGESMKVIVVGNNQKEPGEVYVQTWSNARRSWRAIRVFLLCWTLAAISILIPILHFVLVPLFFFLGLIAPFFVVRRESVVLGGIGSCPFCAKRFAILQSANDWPLHSVCDSCHRHVRIEKA